jgi:hypothetical protein
LTNQEDKERATVEQQDTWKKWKKRKSAKQKNNAGWRKKKKGIWGEDSLGDEARRITI